MSHRARSLRIPLVVMLAAVSTACTTHVAQPTAMAALAPQLTVERFLQAANSRDVASMGRMFGTTDGPLMETGGTFGCMFKKIGSWFGGSACRRRTDVELQLDAIARVLRHDSYRIAREEPVFGRSTPATRVLVDLTVEGVSVPNVPFLVVQGGEGRWLVENVGLEAAMARRGRDQGS